MVTSDSPPADVVIDDQLVRRLLADQHPDLAGLDLAFVTEGWDNALYRLGEELAVRLPRRVAAVQLIEHEQRWLPIIAKHLPLPIPVPERIGAASEVFGYPWSVVPWVPGTDALLHPVADTVDAGARLGEFFAALHTKAPDSAPVNPSRGVPLQERATAVRTQMATLVRSGVVDERLASAFEWGVAANAHSGPPVWLHGDPHAGNIIVRHGQVAAIVDWGDITSGDPASDLTCLWMLLDAAGRNVALDALGADDATIRRGRAWAAVMSTMLLTRSNDRPAYFQLGLRTASEVAGDI